MKSAGILAALLFTLGLFAFAFASTAVCAQDDEDHAHAAGEEDHAHAAGETDHAHDDAGADHAHADGHASHGNTNPLVIDPDLAIVTLLIFLLLLAILWKFAWGPISAGLDKREHHIADEIAAAEASNQDAKKMLQQYELRLAQAGEEVKALLEGAKKDAESMKNSILAEAQQAAASEKDRAMREIDTAKRSAIDEIAEQSVNLAFRVASDAVRRDIKPEDHRGLIDDALKQFSSKN